METINGCTVMMSSQAPRPVTFGPAETSGAYRVLAGTFPADQPAPPFDFHLHTDEAIYVAAGECTCRLGDREIRVPAGGFVFIPRGTPHTARNSGGGPMLGLIMISPGEAEHVVEPAPAG